MTPFFWYLVGVSVGLVVGVALSWLAQSYATAELVVNLLATLFCVLAGLLVAYVSLGGVR